MKQASEKCDRPATALQRDLAARIAGVIHADGLAVGDRLNESRLADRLNVSRTPVRAALRHLAGLGFVRREPNRGVVLSAPPPLPRPGGEPDPGPDALLVLVARDRNGGRLPEQISEAELMRLYGFGRPTVRAVLERLVDFGLAERRPGYGWRFVPALRDVTARRDSYRFRMVVETASIREPGFALPPGWSAEIRARHEAVLRGPWNPDSSIAFFEMNAAFHAGLAAASGNRYLQEAVERQNRLRRLWNYGWEHGFARVETNCREHLEILDWLDGGDREVAAALMARHLQRAAELRPAFVTPD